MSFDFSVITGKVAHDIIHSDIPECMRRVEAAYLTHQDGRSVNPDSYFLRFPEKPDARIIALPAYLGGDVGVSGIKWIASYPSNVQRGFPRASAVLVLNNYETGYPFACLESSIISAARTAGSAVLGAQWMNGGKRHARCLGIVGNGLIARYIYQFLLQAGWEVDEVLLHDSTPGESERFAREVCLPERHQRVGSAPDLNTCLRRSDVIVLATTAGTPHITDWELLAHNPVVLHISLRDIAPELVLRSYNIVDDVEHVMKANTSPHLAEKLSGGRGFVTGTLAQLIRGECKVDRSRPALFSPFGLGVLDLAVGHWVYERAVAEGTALQVPDFFFELKR
ncbi:2,3-diaminopropionate biosynthesis protein SbnB [Pyxidicoccus xibeiensis]|uniref:2,3-diaminopropionate biosynthesis protein SbnB n=1 Tax=Pyxidicoccus xibeiensis TaxID=2906759 RepID=UPI0020A7CA30|nr:2,3-diaminopropionate biosynthesis protein SbnB [Pyxidicoccus xibeiensis]MCP3142125.1 2,3-diaminopropionate biosynthesis protein SbnB [Pyxidicoccus xibeiensis]